MTISIDEHNNLPPSKSQRKRDVEALQHLGRELTYLSKETLSSMALPETLLAAVLDYKRFTANGALRRQMQYIGRLMREIDVAPIQERLNQLKGLSAQHTAWQQALERWRDRLLAEDKALEKLIDHYPNAPIQTLRTLIRNARREQQEQKPPKSYRQIFQCLKTVIPDTSTQQSDECDTDSL